MRTAAVCLSSVILIGLGAEARASDFELELVADSERAVVDGRRLHGFRRAVINDAGDVAFQTSPESGGDYGVWVLDAEGELELLLPTGIEAPGSTKGAMLEDVRYLMLSNDRSSLAAVAPVSNGLDAVFMVGRELPIQPLYLPLEPRMDGLGNGRVQGLGPHISDAGRIALHVRSSEGAQAVLIGDVTGTEAALERGMPPPWREDHVFSSFVSPTLSRFGSLVYSASHRHPDGLPWFSSALWDGWTTTLLSTVDSESYEWRLRILDQAPNGELVLGRVHWSDADGFWPIDVEAGPADAPRLIYATGEPAPEGEGGLFTLPCWAQHRSNGSGSVASTLR